MTTSPALSDVRPVHARPSTPLTPVRLFYSATAALLLLLAFLGFSRFFMHGMAYPGREIPPSIRTVVIAHGTTMTLWLILLLVQPLLILRGSRKVHMTLGMVGVGLAALVVLLGIWVAIASATFTPPEARIWGIPPKQFFAVPFISTFIFAGFVTLGVIYRRKPAIHRPMMLLATLSAMSAAISRIDTLNNLYTGTIFERLTGPFFITLLLSLALLAVRCLLTRSLDKWFAIGLAVLIALDVFIWQIAPTAGWAQVTAMLVK